MELKTARLTLLIDPNKKAAFEQLCSKQDRTASQVVRQLIRDYLIEHGATCVDSGVEMSGAGPRSMRKLKSAPKASSGSRRS